MFGNKMQTSAIPERVYALCRAVASKPMDENTLKRLLEPQNLGGKTPYFGMVRSAAEELQLIQIKENVISLSVDKDTVKSMENMRHYINMHLELVIVYFIKSPRGIWTWVQKCLATIAFPK